MEMNTRLQVEHPVTEAITGLDLVELQLRVAAGEPLPLAQDDVRFGGHAIEVRLCAEDADQGFMPQSGTHGAVADAAPQLRVEHALTSGAEIPPYYDSMIAKIISHGATRDEARRKLVRGLEDAVALGVTTNQALPARAASAHPVFAAGRRDHRLHRPAPGRRCCADDDVPMRAPRRWPRCCCWRPPPARSAQPGRRLTHSLPIASALRDRRASCSSASVTTWAATATDVDIGGRSFDDLQIVAARRTHTRPLHLRRRDGAARPTCATARTCCLHYRGVAYEVEDTTRAATPRAEAAAGSDGKLRASMNGRVVAVLVAVGDARRGRPADVTLEAMKMEHVHAAPLAGIVRILHVSVGEQVAASRVVAEIEGDVAPAA